MNFFAKQTKKPNSFLVYLSYLCWCLSFDSGWCGVDLGL